MAKRSKLEIIKDILKIIQESRNSVKPTPLLRRSNISSKRFKEYFDELLAKNLIEESYTKNGKVISMTEKGQRFLEKYRAIIEFIDEFELGA